MQQHLKLGRTVITPNALERLSDEDVSDALRRHSRGDWGDITPADRDENALAMREGFRLFSVYHDRNGAEFWVITEADRTVTTVLMPDDY